MGSSDFFGYMCHGTEQGRVHRQLTGDAVKRLKKVKINVDDLWVENQDGMTVRVISVAPNSVRYTREDLPDMVLARYRRGFLEDFTPKKVSTDV